MFHLTPSTLKKIFLKQTTGVQVCAKACDTRTVERERNSAPSSVYQKDFTLNEKTKKKIYISEIRTVSWVILDDPVAAVFADVKAKQDKGEIVWRSGQPLVQKTQKWSIIALVA